MGVKIDVADVLVTEHDQRVALALMDALGKTVGPAVAKEATGAVSGRDLHRVIALMAAIVLETDPALLKLKDFRMGGEYLGEMIAMMTKMIRDQRERTGVGLMDLVGSVEPSSAN